MEEKNDLQILSDYILSPERIAEIKQAESVRQEVQRRPLELARRHFERLVELKEAAWIRLIRGTAATSGDAMVTYEALVHAVKLTEAEINGYHG